MKTFNLTDFIGNIMPQADMTAAFVSCFETAKKCGENVQIIIPPGEYHLNATEPVELFSCLSVFAEGASFYFPENMDFPKHRPTASPEMTQASSSALTMTLRSLRTIPSLSLTRPVLVSL